MMLAAVHSCGWLDLAIGDALRLYAEALDGTFADQRIALIEGAIGGLAGLWQAIRLQAQSRHSTSSSAVPP